MIIKEKQVNQLNKYILNNFDFSKYHKSPILFFSNHQKLNYQKYLHLIITFHKF